MTLDDVAYDGFERNAAPGPDDLSGDVSARVQCSAAAGCRQRPRSGRRAARSRLLVT
jgi:hypothetical protein